jgi:SAM-dependent methyltransferase
MQIPWLRRNFLARRRLDRLFLDVPDSVLRSLSGQSYWPPYSLRSFVGEARSFEKIGCWFVEDLNQLGLLGRNARILEIGCGCGRLARPLAVDPKLRELGVSYTGMDVDRAGVDWCRRHVTPLNPRFDFYHADCHNASYNPTGSIPAASYRFPYPDASFDLILLTSVFTHVLPQELTHYLSEIARLLTPYGVAYASFFLYGSDGESDPSSRHPFEFSAADDNYALTLKDSPANAVAFNEDFVRQALPQAGLKLLGAPRYGGQDLLLITREQNGQYPDLLSGWHALEWECWRWTERIFAVRLPPHTARTAALRFRFVIADLVLKAVGIVRLRAWVNDFALPAKEFFTAGEHTYVQEIPPESLQVGESPVIRFELESALRTPGPDERELGVQVLFSILCNGARKAVNAIEIV